VRDVGVDATDVGARTNQAGDLARRADRPTARVEANRSEGIRSEIVESELEVVAVIRARASVSDPRNGRGEPEVVEDAGGDLGVGDKREHAKRIAAARALGDVVPTSGSSTTTKSTTASKT